VLLATITAIFLCVINKSIYLPGQSNNSSSSNGYIQVSTSDDANLIENEDLNNNLTNNEEL
jgi:hypothetical protein